MTRTLLLALTLWSALLCSAYSAGKEGDHNRTALRLGKTNTLNDAKPILINNLFSYFSNTGIGSLNPFTNGDGVEYLPSTHLIDGYQNTGAMMNCEGLLWAGYHRGSLKSGGSSYSSGLQPGEIILPGTAAQPPVAADGSQPHYRVYRVRPDMYPIPYDGGEILKVSEVPWISRYDPSATAASLFGEYTRDWREWPGNEGAPYTDMNHNGRYEPEFDIPGVPGADATLWFVCNDMDSVRTKALYGALPIGIEMQKTIWAYHRPGALDNTIFQRTRLINKSGSPIDSMFVMQFSDPEVGGELGYNNDYAGCDTLRNLGYAYNGTDVPDYTFGTQVPAIGLDLLAGPAVPASGTDSAFVNFSFRRGYRNLPMTSFAYLFKFADAIMGDYRGTTQIYNYMKGLQRAGEPIVNAQTGAVTNFYFPGDPVARSGWVEGDPSAPGGRTEVPADRRCCIASGPFTMAAADTQDILVAEIVGRGPDRLSSVAVLRSYEDAVEKYFRSNFVTPSSPPGPLVRVSELDGRIVLNWSDERSASACEAYSSAGYRFQGYNVYQVGPNLYYPVRVATFDIADGVQVVTDTLYDDASENFIAKAVAFGTDSGVRRFFSTTWDSIRHAPLVDGSTCYFGVTAYMYNPLAIIGTKIIESRPSYPGMVPQPPKPGWSVPAQFGQIISDDPARVTSVGMKERSVIVSVIDPYAITGHAYAVRFSGSDTVTWSVYDSTWKRLVVSGAKNYTTLRDDLVAGRPFMNDPSDPIADGLQFSVVAPPERAEYQWSLSTAGLIPAYSSDRVAFDAERINVYPNPYFMGNARELWLNRHVVTFNHLPQKAVIHIFALNGVRVRVIVKDDPSQFATWDLLNEHDWQVAAGIYVVYISLPESGTTKILKLAVIPPTPVVR